MGTILDDLIDAIESFLGMQSDADQASDKKVGSPEEPCHPEKERHQKPRVTVKIQEAPETTLILRPQGQAPSSVVLHAIHADPPGGQFKWSVQGENIVKVDGARDASTLTVTEKARGVATARVTYTFDGQSASDTAKVRVGAPMIKVTPAVLDFASVEQGNQSKPLTLRIQNTGDARLSLTSVSLLSDTHFEILDRAKLPASLAPHDSPATLRIIFKPQKEGEQATNVRVVSNAANVAAVEVAVKGKALPKVPVTPSITPEKIVVVVKKPHTHPKRHAVTLKADMAGAASGTLSRSNDNVDLFTTEKGGTKIQFNGKDNVFSGAKLVSGVKLFAEGAKPGETAFTLTLTKGAKDVKPPNTKKITSVAVTLHIANKAGAVLSEADKIAPGRIIHVQDKSGKRLRAKMDVKIEPATFAGTVNLKPQNDKVAVFAAASGGAAIATPHAVKNGDVLFAEGAKVSGALKDTGFILDVDGVEPDADHVKMTVIEAKLDVCKSREKAGKDPDPLTDDDKIKNGRAIHLQDATNSRHRAMLIVRRVKPADFVGKLVLTPINAKVKVFQNETPAAGEAALATPLELDHTARFPAKGERRFAEGAALSAAKADTGVKLGVKDIDDECDHVAITVFQVEKVEVKLRGTPCRRDGSRANTMAAKVITKDSKTFDATAITIVRECGDLTMEATVKPNTVTLAWDIEQAADDAVKSPTPTHADNGGDKKRKVTANRTGSFHVFAFVDANGNGKRNNGEDGVTVNVNIVNITVPPGAANNKILHDPRFRNTRSTAASLVVDSGGPAAVVPATQSLYGDGVFAGHAIAMKVTVQLHGGGGNQRRGTDKITLGYIQTTTADTIVGTYADGKTEKEVIFANPLPAGPPDLVGGAVVAGVHPALAFPVRDHRGAANAGTGTFINSSSDADKADLPAGGQKKIVRFIDSPAIVIDMTHPVTGSALASIAGSNFFQDFLVAFSSDFDENFTVVASATWTATYGTFTAAGGWVIAGAVVVPSGAAMGVNSPLVKGESTAVERCPPGFTDNLIMDAR